MPAYPDANQWSTKYQVYVKVVDKSQAVVNGIHPLKTIMTNKTIITDPNLQTKLLSAYDQKSKLKAQEWSKLKANEKALTTIVYEQCDDASQTEIALDPNCETYCKDGNLINFLTRVRTVCYGSEDRGVSSKPYKNVVVVKSLNNFTNIKPNNHHRFKEDLKIKYNAVLAFVRTFPNGTGPMLELL